MRMAKRGNANTAQMREGDYNYVQKMQSSVNYQNAAMAAQLMTNNQQIHRGRKEPTQTIWNDGHMVIDNKTYLKSNSMIYNSPGSDMVVEKTSHHSHHQHNRRRHDGHRRHHNHHDNHHTHYDQGYCNCGCSNPNYILDTNNNYNTTSGTNALLLANGSSNDIVQYQPIHTTPRALICQPVASGYTSASSSGSSHVTVLADRYAPRQTDPRCHCRHKNHCTCLHRIETRSHERLLPAPPSPLQPIVVSGRLGLDSCRRCLRRVELFTGGYCGGCQVERGIEVGRREHRSIRYYDHDDHDDRGRSRSRGIRRRVDKEIWE